jgi:LacI family transcriptional regulator
MPTKRVTINDVAAAAGVSRQTVTRAMNAMSEITPETRDRVLRVSDELGYRPSRFASNLARQKHHSVGLVVATLRNPYYTELAADLLDVAVARGWQTSIETSNRISEEDVVARLATQVDAIVGYFSVADETALKRAARGVPLVMVERAATMSGVHSIELDFRTGMADFIQQLRSRGSARFGMIDTDLLGREHSPSPRRLAFEEAVGSARPTIVTAPETVQGAASAFAELWRGEPAVDTVIVFNDLMAMGAMQSAHALGLEIPRDVRIVGIDGLSLGEVMHPPLTTLGIDRGEIAITAADIVAECLDAHREASISRMLVPRPLWRMSA